MKYMLGLVAIVGYIALSHSQGRKKYRVKQQLEQLYLDISGFNIDKKEYKKLQRQGVDPTYAEITFEATQQLLSELRITTNDILYDLGSGVGKFVVHAYLATPARKVVGVELSPTRHNLAMGVRDALSMMDGLDDERTLKFQKENIIDTDLSDATIIYMCSTCFEHSFMKQLCQLFCELKPGLRVVTLKRFPKGSPFKLLNTLELSMTWSKGSSVFIYQLRS